jgi:uncharacterized protein
MIPVKVAGLIVDNRSNSPVVLLQEEQGERVLPIFIGPAEAAGIALALEKAASPRPVTLELMKLLIEGLEARVVRIVVTALESDTFLASLMVEREGKVYAFDARPSDSIGLALRAEAPIFVADRVMDAAGQIPAQDEDAKLKDLQEELRKVNPEDLGGFKI